MLEGLGWRRWAGVARPAGAREAAQGPHRSTNSPVQQHFGKDRIAQDRINRLVGVSKRLDNGELPRTGVKSKSTAQIVIRAEVANLSVTNRGEVSAWMMKRTS